MEQQKKTKTKQKKRTGSGVIPQRHMATRRRGREAVRGSGWGGAHLAGVWEGSWEAAGLGHGGLAGWYLGEATTLVGLKALS